MPCTMHYLHELSTIRQGAFWVKRISRWISLAEVYIITSWLQKGHTNRAKQKDQERTALGPETKQAKVDKL